MPKTSAAAKKFTPKAKKPAVKSATAGAPLTPAASAADVQADYATSKLPNIFALSKMAVATLCQNWKVLLGIGVVYGLLNLLLLQGFNSVADLNAAKESFGTAGGFAHIGLGISMYSYLVSTSGSNVGPTAGTYQFALALVVSLAVIWTLRQVYAGYKPRVRDSFYRGMYPLVPVLLVLAMIIVQLLPFMVGALLYTIVLSNGIVTNVIEQLIALVVFAGLSAISVYLVSASSFAVYIVCLPDMTPMVALRSAKELVAHRRWPIIRKLLFVPLALLVVAGVVLVPVILVATAIAPWVFLLVGSLLLVVVHSYMYALYRALL